MSLECPYDGWRYWDESSVGAKGGIQESSGPRKHEITKYFSIEDVVENANRTLALFHQISRSGRVKI